MAADDIGFDMIEEILIRSDTKDVIIWKGVCKSWYSLISTPYFVESVCKRIFNNDLEHHNKRISRLGCHSSLSENELFLIGSSNGLVCISPKDFELVIVNPCTKQTMEILQPPPESLPESDRRWYMVWGFGYDSSNNDFKIVVGLVTEKTSCSATRFYVFSLKTCLWKFIKEIGYEPCTDNISGVLCDGALHWVMTNWQTLENVILSFNLSREEFTKTQIPEEFVSSYYTLGVVNEFLCMYNYRDKLIPAKIWMLRSWVALPHNYAMNHDAVYIMDDVDDYSIEDTPNLLSNSLTYICLPIYVQSLVSPHVNVDSSSTSGSNDVVISVEATE